MKRFLLGILILLVGCSAPTASVCYSDTCFEATVADSAEERRQGLMNVDYLEEDEGMLFIFEREHVYPFWMKDTLIPLDIIWLDSNGRIVYIEHNAQPCDADPCVSYNPGFAASYVLEVNGGIAAELGMKPGDILRVE